MSSKSYFKQVVNRPGFYVEPTIISGLTNNAEIVQKETFAPIVYILKASSVDEAICWNNEVDQGLSSSIFTNNLETIFSKVFDFNSFLVNYNKHFKQ